MASHFLTFIRTSRNFSRHYHSLTHTSKTHSSHTIIFPRPRCLILLLQIINIKNHAATSSSSSSRFTVLLTALLGTNLLTIHLLSRPFSSIICETFFFFRIFKLIFRSSCEENVWSTVKTNLGGGLS